VAGFKITKKRTYIPFYGGNIMATIQKYTKSDGSKAYMFKAYLGTDPLTGKQRRTTRRGFKTIKEAKTELSRLLLKIERDGIVVEKNATFKEVFDMWIEIYQKSVQPSTLDRTMVIFNTHILPKLGDLKINKITPAYMQKQVNWYVDKGTYKNYRLIITYINRIFKYAVNMNLCDNNPIDKVIIPAQKNSKQKKLKFYTKQQLHHFLNTIQDEEIEPLDYLRIRDYALFRLLAFSGCRIGEVLALEWDDLNELNSYLSITKTVTEAGHYYISPTPKTAKSNREIAIDKKTIHALKEWHIIQMKYLMSHGYQKPKYIFTSKENGFLVNSVFAERYKKYQKAANLPHISLHGFRHTHASLLFEAGATAKEVQERLGHTNISTTLNIYTHITDETKNETKDKLANYLNF